MPVSPDLSENLKNLIKSQFSFRDTTAPHAVGWHILHATWMASEEEKETKSTKYHQGTEKIGSAEARGSTNRWRCWTDEEKKVNRSTNGACTLICP